MHVSSLSGASHPVLRKAQATWESRSGTFTIGKLPGSSTVEFLNHTLHDAHIRNRRVQEQLNAVQAWLPEFRATFTEHDDPTQFVGWEMRKAAEEAAERGECASSSFSAIDAEGGVSRY
jgi:hypothetical protein